ncbi:MAG: hypothetical protein PHY31_07790, partial [Smithellaceae bacterium]|nr:hypothetical protein [Smithellaceae bacterium]
CRHVVPHECLHVVFGNSLLTLVVETAEVQLGLQKLLAAGLPEPLDGLGVVLGHTLTFVVHYP